MNHNECLIIEDNKIVAGPLIKALSQQGYIVDHVTSAEEAIQRVTHTSYDIILLDLILPGMDGQEFIKTFRENQSTPILVISEKHSDVGKAISLELGADDYITKPVSIIELVARIKAIIRRSYPTENTETLTFKNISLNPGNHEALKNNERIPLTVKEYKILKLFFEHPNSVLSKQQIFKNIWDRHNNFGDDNLINVHMRRLRQKIEDDPANPKIIETVWGFGYRLYKD